MARTRDGGKWAVLFILVFAVIAVLVSGILTDWYTVKDKYCLFSHDYNEDNICIRCGADKPIEDLEQANSNVVVNTVVEQGMQLYAAPLADNPDTYTLTASITPASADDKRVEWSVAWKNPQSVWAIGKTVTEYVTVTPSADNELIATVACVKDFGEQIVVTVKSLDNEEATAACTVDYVQRIKGFTFNMPSVSSTTTSFTYDIEYSSYTIAADISINVSGKCELDEDYMSDLFADGSDLIGFSEFEVCAPLLTKNGNTLTFAPDLAAFEQKLGDSFYTYEAVSGLVGCFIMYDGQQADRFGVTDGDFIYLFRYELDSYEAPCTFDVTYSATYNGKTYSQGMQTIGVTFDGQALHVPVANVSLSQGSLVF